MIWTDKDREDYADSMGMSQSMREELKWRRRGSSTRIAFSTFAEAYERRGEWIQIKDHYASADGFLFDTMRRMAMDLRFTFEWKRTYGKYYLRLKDSK